MRERYTIHYIVDGTEFWVTWYGTSAAGVRLEFLGETPEAVVVSVEKG